MKYDITIFVYGAQVIWRWGVCESSKVSDMNDGKMGGHQCHYKCTINPAVHVTRRLWGTYLMANQYANAIVSFHLQQTVPTVQYNNNFAQTQHHNTQNTPCLQYVYTSTWSSTTITALKLPVTVLLKAHHLLCALYSTTTTGSLHPKTI